MKQVHSHHSILTRTARALLVLPSTLVGPQVPAETAALPDQPRTNAKGSGSLTESQGAGGKGGGIESLHDLAFACAFELALHGLLHVHWAPVLEYLVSRVCCALTRTPLHKPRFYLNNPFLLSTVTLSFCFLLYHVFPGNPVVAI